MYESPIEKIYGDIESQIIKQDEEHMMYTVNQAIGYEVDKDELLKALQYDRGQYQKGYQDAKSEIVMCNECIHNKKASRSTYTCDRGHRFEMRISDTFYCADGERGENKDESKRNRG